MNQLQTRRVSSFYFIFLTFLLLSPTSSLSWYSPTILFDLEGTGNAFRTNANDWTARKLVNDAIKTYNCAGDYLLGGWNVLYRMENNYFERQYTGLPSHNMISFSFKFHALDGWDGPPDGFEISFDGITFPGFEVLSNNNNPAFSNRCGMNTKVDVPPIIVLVNVPHTGSTVTLRVTSLLNNSAQEESGGFREIIMEFLTVTTPGQWICGISDMALPYRWCPCADGKYTDPPQSGKCADCHSSCATCVTLGSTNCLSCHPGFYLSGGQCFPCVSPCQTCTGNSNGHCLSCTSGLHLTGATCFSTCDPPLQSTTVSGVLYCGRECETSVTLWDGNCAATCDSPLILETVNNLPTCKFPCAANEFAYWDGSCDSACPSPLIKRYVSNRKICEYPCSGTDIVYWHGECGAHCLPPFQLESHSNYDVCVSSCAGNLFLYPDGTCRSDCPKPYSSYIDKTAYICDYSCSSGSYYLMQSQSCVSPCPSGYYPGTQDRICLACKDPLCDQCSITGITCNACKNNAILDSDGVCKRCEFLKTQYIKPIGSDSHEYVVTLAPDSCDLSASFVKSLLLPTSETKKNFPKFSFQTSYTSPHTYKVKVTFDDSVLQSANLDITLSYLTGSLVVPKTITASELAKDLEKAAPVVTTTIATTMGTSFGATLAMGASTMMWSMLSFQQFLGYFIYLNIDYPPQLETFLSFFSFTDWDFLPNPIASLTEDWKEDLSLDESSLEGESRYQLPPKFVKYQVSPFFIDNGGSLITINLIILISPFLLHHLRRIRVLKIDRLLWKTEMNLKWNGIFRAFLENSIPMLFATLIQLKKFSYDNIYVALSTFLAIIAFSYLTAMLHFVWDTLQAQTKNRLELPLVKILYGTLYEGIELKDSAAKYYHLFIMLRGFLLIFLAVFLDVQPVLQVVPLLIYNGCILCYLLKKNIFEDPKMNIINKIKEFLIIVGELSVLGLCIENKPQGYYQALGWLAVCALSLATLIELAYLVTLQVVELIRAVKKLWQFLFSKKELRGKKILREFDSKIKRKIRTLPKIKRHRRERLRRTDLSAQLGILPNEFSPLDQSQGFSF